MIKNRFFMLCGIIGLAYSASSSAVDSISCNNCSINQKTSAAQSWTSVNTPRNGSTTPFRQLHIIDEYNQNVTTFNTRLFARYQSYVYPYGYTYQPDVVEIQTPDAFRNTANDFFARKAQFKSTLNDVVIPASVIPSSWAFTDCAYCANDVGDYIRNNTDAHTVWLQAVSIAQLMGLSGGPTAERHVVKLADGGKIEIEIKLTDSSISVDVVKITDPNNNNVAEFSSQMLSGMTYRLSDAYFSTFQHYMFTLGFITNRNTNTGTVTIQECRMPQDPPNSLPLCYLR